MTTEGPVGSREMKNGLARLLSHWYKASVMFQNSQSIILILRW